MMTESSIQHATPTWALVATLLGIALLLGIVVWLSRMSPQARGRALFWIFGGLGVALLGLLTFGVTTVREIRTQRIQTQQGDESSPATTVITASPVIEGTTPATSPFSLRVRSFSPFWRSIYDARFKLALVIGIGVIALVAARGKSGTTVPATDKPADVKSGLAWLTVPAASLAVLAYLSAPILVPTPNPNLTMPPSIPPAIEAKMDKTVKDLVKKSEDPDSQLAPLPEWVKNKPTADNSFRLTSQQYGSQAEAEAELLPLGTELLQRAFHQVHPWQGPWNVPLAQFRERVVVKAVPQRGSVTTAKGPLETYGVHWWIDLSPEVCETFTASWKSQIIERRLKVFGVLVVWLSGVLLMGRAYFWSLTLPGNTDRWGGMLKASIGTAGLTGLAAWVLLEFIR